MKTSKSILIIEDDKAIRETVRDILITEGFEILEASNGIEGMTVLKKLDVHPVLILLDIMMPIMNGTQFRVEQLKEPALANIPTIVMSADRSFHQSPNELQFATVLKKPIDLDDLLSSVAQFSSKIVNQ